MYCELIEFERQHKYKVDIYNAEEYSADLIKKEEVTSFENYTLFLNCTKSWEYKWNSLEEFEKECNKPCKQY